MSPSFPLPSPLFTLQIVDEMHLDVGSFEAFIASLNNQGYLLKKGPRTYQLRTVDM